MLNTLKFTKMNKSLNSVGLSKFQGHLRTTAWPFGDTDPSLS